MFFKKKLVNIVYLSGVINHKGKKSLSLNNIKPLLDKAFKKNKSTKAVVLFINSPGGSASQSEIIANYIKSLSEENNIPVISFVEDMAASGGYFIAAAAPEIYALSKTSIVGSIGVLYSSFGFPNFIKKYGIERRVHTSGKNKVILDPFKEEKQQDIEIINDLLQETHLHFKNFIKESRGSKLKLNDEELFSGKFWLSSTGVNIGLIDGIIDNYDKFLKDRFGKKVIINIIKHKKGMFEGLFFNKISIDDNLIDTILTNIKENTQLKSIQYK